SYRSASIGSTFVARRAGTKLAARATPVSNTETATKVSGSVALTPNNNVDITRVTAIAPATPTATPISASVSAFPTTLLNTSPGRAPNAILMPISRVRWVTRYDVTPYSPTAAKTSARTANVASKTVLKRGVAADCETSCFIV